MIEVIALIGIIIIFLLIFLWQKKRKCFLYYIFDYAPFGVIILNKKAIIKQCNQELEKYLGLPKKQIIGSFYWNFFDQLDNEKEKELWEKLTTKKLKEYRIEKRCIRKDKTMLWLSIRISLLNNTYVVGIIEDMTKNKHTIRALYESEKRYRNLLENSNELLATLSKEGYFLFINPMAAKSFGRKSEDLIGRSVTEILPSPAAENILFAIQEVIKTEKHYTGEIVLGNRYFHYSLQPIKHPIHHTLQALFFIAMDFTALKKAEEEKEKMKELLLRSQKMEAIGRLAGNISHDFKNFMSVIKGYVDLAMMDNPPESTATFLKEIAKVAEKAYEITQQLLLFSRKEEKKHTLVDIKNVIENLKMMIANLIGKTIPVKINLKENLPLIIGNSGQIEQVILNLLINARDAMQGREGEIQLTLDTVFIEEGKFDVPNAKTGNYLCLSIKDQGIGMSDMVLAHIFEPFFTTKEPGKGTGLGLAIVYGIVEQHNGFITVESELNVGTTFKIYFPAYEEKKEE